MSLKSHINTLKNGTIKRDRYISLKLSKETLSLVKFLVRNGLIRNFEVSKDLVTVFLKFDKFGNPALNALWMVPGFKFSMLNINNERVLSRNFNIPLILYPQEQSGKKRFGTCKGIIK